MSKLYLLGIGFFFIVITGVTAQDKDSQSEATFFFKEGKKLYKSKEFMEAQKQFLTAFEIYESKEDWSNWYKCISQLRKLGTSLQQYEATYDSLLVWKTRVPKAETKIRGKLTFYQAYFLSNILGEQVNGLSRYKDALELHIEARDTNFIISSYENISYGYSKLGDQLSAINYLSSGYEIAKVWGKESALCEIINSLGKYYFHDGQHQKAKEKYLESLRICIDKDYSNLYLAELYLQLDELEEAKKYLDLVNKGNTYVMGDYHIEMAQYFNKKKMFSEASKEQEVVLYDLKNSWDRRLYIKELVRYAQILVNGGRSEEAVKNAHFAMCEFLDCKDSLDFKTRPIAKQNLSEIWVIEALYIKANYFQNLYINNGDTKAKDEALFYYEYLFELFDNLRSNYYAIGSKYRIGAYAQKIYADAISFLFSLYDSDNSVEHLERAFDLSQKSNSFVLKNTISEMESLEIANVSIDSINQYHQLSLHLKEQIDKDNTNDEFYQLSKNYEEFKSALYTNYPKLKMKPTAYKISISDVKKSLNKKSALLKYFQHGNTLYLFVITKTDQFMKEILLPQKFNALMDSNRNVMTTINSFDSNIGNIEADYLKKSKEIYNIIFGGLLESLKFKSIDHLYIVPDGDLKEIAFNTLITKESNDWTNSENYLVNNYAVSYLHYCAQLSKNNDQKHTRKGGFVGVGIKYEKAFLEDVLQQIKLENKDKLTEVELRNLRMSPLKYAVDEVKQISLIFGGDYYVNENVNPTSIISKIKNREIVHFSVHALVDGDDYYNSFILLNKDSDDNYKLSYKDVLRENINSDLVVLSACQTGLGHQVSGEGLMSMTRAFIQSGSDATMGSYWNAPDKPTMEIMELFYSNIKQGMTKSKALQQAQLSYLTDDMRSSPLVRAPHFWGAWVIFGSDEPIMLENNFSIYYWFGGFVLILILFVIIRRKK